MDSPSNAPSMALQPRIHSASAIRDDPALERRIRDFANEGYRYIAPKDASRWDPDDDDRLADASSINQELGEHGFFAVLYDPGNEDIPIACAATKPWKADLEGGGQGDEGWEIKIVTSGAGWMRGGYAGRCINAIVDELVRRAAEEDASTERSLNVWIQTVKCVNGEYWMKKGWREVRSYDKPAGHWGSREGYQLLVLLQQFKVVPEGPVEI
ncbi:hypothetical protein IQ07DRAFT_588641 [Pyrenochaeta sp. DS3sAY3a]|nr:hypothetical protein IQ07DRAFT_588641 [Pyrenochaeta sp. DS3sAY3a]